MIIRTPFYKVIVGIPVDLSADVVSISDVKDGTKDYSTAATSGNC